MRTESAASAKSARPCGQRQRMPRPGTRLRELWDLLHIYRGEVLEQPLTVRFGKTDIDQLRDFYGLDIRKIGHFQWGLKPGQGSGRWCLVGEWFGREYKDYIAERLTKMEKPKC